MPAHVLLNIDAGESDDEPIELYSLAHLVNIACGGHAGDDRTMARVLAACRASGTLAGAHPSYPDRDGFGRRTIPLAPRALFESLASQCERLAAIANERGVVVGYAKAHGALYHDANHSPELAGAVVRAAIETLGRAVTIVGPPRGALREAALAADAGFAREAFADRALLADGSLAPRSSPGALLTDPADVEARVRAILDAGEADTICVHGDTDGAVLLARVARDAIAARGR